MKRKKAHKKHFTKRNIFIAAVSLILVCMMSVTSTTSWIEEVSKVEFNSSDGQETPLHIGNRILLSDAVMEKKTSSTAVDLEQYFNLSGDLHLSPCYGDGENFYFPIENGTNNASGYRVGTKDDANVNYLSVTFRVQSVGAATAYWFEKTGNTAYVSFKNGGSNGTTVAALSKYLRCSVTVDGATNVYCIDDPNTSGYQKTYTTIVNNATSAKTGRSVEEYTYYQESFNQNNPEGYYKNSANITNKPNQGTGSNLNNNTLFTVNKYDTDNSVATTKTVTVKLWLEAGAYDGGTRISGVDLSSIHLNLVSGWDKTRRVYVKDSTVHQATYSGANWLSTQSAKLYFALKNDMNNNHWLMTRIGSSNFYYADIPAVYNNTEAVLFRCNNGWNVGSQSVTYNNVTVSYWDKWETTFPDSYHSETYTVYSTDFATWEEASEVHCIYYINSEKFGTSQFGNVYDYMWDSNSIYDSTSIDGKVVKNANWPGIRMTTKMNATARGHEVYAFFYNSDYDRIIFSDGFTEPNLNREFQTQDLWLTNSEIGKTFDMSTLTWFSTSPGASDWSSDLPTYSDDNTYLYGNFVTGQRWMKYRFAYGGEFGSSSGAFNGTNSGNMLSKVYAKSAGDYEFIVYYNGTCYKTYQDNVNLYAGNSITLGKQDYYVDGHMNNESYKYKSNVYAKNLTAGTVYRFYLSNVTSNTITISLASGEALT